MSNLDIGEKEFNKAISKLALIDFYAEWCMPCITLAPIIEELAEKFRNKIKIAKVNVDENQKLSQKFQVMSIPTLIIFKDGKEAERIMGAHPLEFFEDKLKKYI